MRILLAVLAGALTAYLSFSTFFRSREDFIDCIKFFFTPDIISIFKGQYFADY